MKRYNWFEHGLVSSVNGLYVQYSDIKDLLPTKEGPMTDLAYIRAGVELADGYSVLRTNVISTPLGEWVESIFPVVMIHALVAQLASQVDAIHPEMLAVWSDLTRIRTGTQKFFYEAEGRTMNTLKVIVDSGLLK